MNTKTTIILFGTLVGIFVVFAVTQITKVKPPGELDALVLPEFHDTKKGTATKDIDMVEIKRTKPREETLVFAKENDTWRLVKPHQLRVQGHMVQSVIDQVTRARKEKADLSTSLAEYGLDEPALTVTLKRGVDREWKVNVGKETAGSATAMIYVTSSARKEPMAVRKAELNSLFKSLNEFRAMDLLSVGPLNAEAVSVKVGEGDILSLQKNRAGKWLFEKPAFGEAEFEGEPGQPGVEEKKISGVRELLDTIGSIRAESEADFVEPSASELDLAKKYGLEKGKPERLRAEVNYSPGSLLGKDEKRPPVTDALLIGKRVETQDAKVPRYYARLESENAVVKVAAPSFEPLVRVAGSPEMLRNRDLVQLDLNRVDAVDVKNATGTVKLRKQELAGSWRVFGGGPGRNADRMAMQNLLSDLTRKRQVKSFPTEKEEAKLGFDKPTAEVSIWVDGLKGDDKKEEKKDDKKDDKKDEKKATDEPTLKKEKPTVHLTFGKKEDNVIYVKRQIGDEKPTLLAVETSALAEKLDDGALAYLERMLPPLPLEETITKIVLQHQDLTFELEKNDDKSAPPVWTVVQPAYFKGRTGDPGNISRLITALRHLNADKFVAEKPSDAELEAKYGLKLMPLKITLTTKEKDKAEDHVFLFGKATEDKSGVYAKLGKSDLVFTIQAHVPKLLEFHMPFEKGLVFNFPSHILLDPTVFKFDPAKVRGLKLGGWGDTAIPPLDLERKDGQWTDKNRKDFPLDGGKVDSLLSGLAGLRAQKFLSGAAKPEHKVTLKDGAMEIAITFEGDKEPTYTLIVGPVIEADKGQYSTSNKFDKTVLLLPEGLFKGPMSGTSYFRR